MRVVVTAGGTREPIDDVRAIANISTGRLGARLADTLLRAGHSVDLLHGTGAVLPSAPEVARHRYQSSAELMALLEAHVPGADAVVHAAAVSDYLPVRSAGKLSSDADELVLRFVRAPKLIDRLRALAPDAVLVGFKLTSGLSEDERLAAARELIARARLDFVVANDSAAIDEHDHDALFVTADGIEAHTRGKAAVAAAIVSALEARRAGGRRTASP